ncbi:MAG: lipase family protein [Roseiarcus sp.]|jgi:hypothetical protein
MPFTNSTAAGYALLNMHAMDMYRNSPGSLRPQPAPGLTAAGWTILGYITGNDALIRNGPIGLADQTVCYGYLASRAPNELVAVIRGTDSFSEWIEDAEFLTRPYAPRIGLPPGAPAMRVEQGFWGVYATMALLDPGGVSLGLLAPAIAGVVGGAGRVTIIGHSLGSAVGTYLTLDLSRGDLQGRVAACLFASPRPGDQAFVSFFDHTVVDYRLFNYILDLVPRVPPGPDYFPLPRRTVIQPTTAEAIIRVGVACSHHVVCYAGMLDYEGTRAATTPVPDGEQGSLACILGPETGKPSLAKQLVSDLAGVAPA